MKKVNYVAQLNTFWKKAIKEKKLKASHVSAYFMLFQEWNQRYFKDTFQLELEEMRPKAKMAKTTFYNCLKELDALGYLKYDYTPGGGGKSYITMIPFSLPGGSDPESEPVTSPDSGPRRPRSGKVTHPKLGSVNNKTNKQILNGGPSLEEVLVFFSEQQYPDSQARRFWLYYDALNWHIGKSPIINWPSLAQKWMFNPPKASNKKKHYDDEPF